MRAWVRTQCDLQVVNPVIPDVTPEVTPEVTPDVPNQLAV